MQFPYIHNLWFRLNQNLNLNLLMENKKLLRVQCKAMVRRIAMKTLFKETVQTYKKYAALSQTFFSLCHCLFLWWASENQRAIVSEIVKTKNQPCTCQWRMQKITKVNVNTNYKEIQKISLQTKGTILGTALVIQTNIKIVGVIYLLYFKSLIYNKSLSNELSISLRTQQIKYQHSRLNFKGSQFSPHLVFTTLL